MIDGFHRPEHAFLSNFLPLREGYQIWMRNPVTGVRKLFSSVEHAYQAANTLDDDDREWIRGARFAGIAKKMGSKAGWKGRRINLRPNWDDLLRLQVMKALVPAKFKDPTLAELLMSTGDELIQESNWWGDSWFGVVVSRGFKPCVPYGENHLGRILMEIRSKLRALSRG